VTPSHDELARRMSSRPRLPWLVAESQGHLLGYVSLFAGIALPNPPSIRLHENLGFRPVGVFANAGFKLEAWQDVGWWSLQLVPALPGAPDEPREWSGTREVPADDVGSGNPHS
jgi:hypothetical protein